MSASREAREQFGAQLRRIRVSRIETGKQTATVADVESWADAVGLNRIKRGLLVAESRHVHFEYSAWQTRLRSGTAKHLRSMIGPGLITEVQRIFEPDIIPGLLQTADYARCVLQHVVHFDALPDDVDEGVRTRLRRQAVLKDTRKRFQFLIGESALLHRICPDGVLCEQRAHLATAGTLPNVEIRTLPFTASLPVLMLEGFWIYDDRQVRVETLNAELVYRQRYDVERYERVFTELWTAGVELFG
jgi:Domain of unknown function (DUF5753)